MRVLAIALKDVTQILADRRVLIFTVAMPLVFTLFMGITYRGADDSGAAPEDPAPIAVGWVNGDADGALSAALEEMLATSGEFATAAYGEPEQALDAVRAGDVAAALVVPAGYSQAALVGDAQLSLIADQGTVPGRAATEALRGMLTRLWSANEIARLAASEGGGYAPTLRAALDTWDKALAAQAAGSRVRLEIATRPSDGAEGVWYGDNPYNQASPGILLQFAIMALVSASQVLVNERKSTTLQRMMTTSLSRWQILAGHGLAMWAVSFAQVALLVLFGQLVLGVDYFRAPLAILAVSAGLSLWVATLGLLIGGIARDDSQVVLFSLMAMFVFTALGGAWFPLEISGGGFAAVGRMLPSGQAIIGYQNVVIRGLGLSSVVTPVLALMCWAAGFGLLAWWRFRREV